MKRFRNVFIVAVHESWSCIWDLLKNLRHCEPQSRIVLYNGSHDPDLLKGIPLQEWGVEAYPNPRPQYWGRMHHFAMDCMRYALSHGSFDCLTVVDSDQLALRLGYQSYIAAFMAEQATPGMYCFGLSGGRPLRQHSLKNRNIEEEKELWRPFLAQFGREPENSFYKGFWPGTVFSRAVCVALVERYDEDALFKEIWENTHLKVVEETLFPTAVAAMGFPVNALPIDSQLVSWQNQYALQTVRRSFSHKKAFWIHPVPRQINHPLRRMIATHFGYAVHQLYYRRLRRDFFFHPNEKK